MVQCVIQRRCPTKPRHFTFVTIVAALLFVGLSSASAASITYTYTGNDFTSRGAYDPYTGTYPDLPSSVTLTHISLQMTFAGTSLSEFANLNGAPMLAAPSSFLMSDGYSPNTITELGAALFLGIQLWTDSNGEIYQWYIQLLHISDPWFYGFDPWVTSNDPSDPNHGVGDLAQTLMPGFDPVNYPAGLLVSGSNIGNPGVWSGPVVPEPSSVLLLACGMLAIALAAWERTM